MIKEGVLHPRRFQIYAFFNATKRWNEKIDTICNRMEDDAYAGTLGYGRAFKPDFEP